MKDNKKQIKANSKRYNEIKKALRSGGMLEIPKGLLKEGYYPYLASDAKPGRIRQLEELGYEKIMNKDGITPYTTSGGVSNGATCTLHGMQISLEMKEQIDFVKETERGVTRESNLASAFNGLNQDELYQKQGMGDISSLSNIKKL